MFQEYYRHSVTGESHYRHSVTGESQYHGKSALPHYSNLSLPLSTPPPSYHSIPLAVEAASAANQIQPIYTAARRDSRASSSLSFYPPEAPPVNYYPPMYEQVQTQSRAPSIYPDESRTTVDYSSSSSYSSNSHSRSRGVYPFGWPLPPCEGAVWVDPGPRGYSREAVEIHNMYHHLVEEEGWLSPLMTVTPEDEARRRRFQLIFGHDFFW